MRRYPEDKSTTRYLHAWDDSGDFWTRLDLETGFTERLIGSDWVRSTETLAGVPIEKAVSGDWSTAINVVGLGRVIQVKDYLLAPIAGGLYGTVDGISWSDMGAGITGNIMDVVYANDEYVVARLDGSTVKIETTVDFLEFTLKHSILSVGMPTTACLATDGNIVMYSGGATGANNIPIWSDDNFTTVNDIDGVGDPPKASANSIDYLNGIWIFVGTTAGTSYTSTTTPASGNWTMQPDIYSTQQSHGVYVPGLWCGDKWYSIDGVNWIRSTGINVTTTNWNCFTDGVRAYYPTSGLYYNPHGPFKYGFNPGQGVVANFKGVWVGWATNFYYYL